MIPLGLDHHQVRGVIRVQKEKVKIEKRSAKSDAWISGRSLFFFPSFYLSFYRLPWRIMNDQQIYVCAASQCLAGKFSANNTKWIVKEPWVMTYFRGLLQEGQVLRLDSTPRKSLSEIEKFFYCPNCLMDGMRRMTEGRKSQASRFLIYWNALIELEK